MKNSIKAVYIIMNFWRLLIPIYIYSFDRNYKELIVRDVSRLNISNLNNNFLKVLYGILFLKEFRSIYYFRISNHKLLKKISNFFLQNKLDIEIGGKIEGGLAIYHGQSSVIYLTKAGTNLSIYQNVTIGRNKDHYSEKKCDKPVIGNNVSIYPGAVVAGGIEIGDNVEIGANSVVLKSVPSNCIVVGNPAKIVRKNGKKVDIDLNHIN